VTRFIDVHVHPPLQSVLDGPFGPYLDGLEAQTGRSITPLTTDELADLYRNAGGKAVLAAWDAETATKRRPLDQDRVLEMVAAHPDVFSGVGAVDPHKGARAVQGVNDAHRLGLRGLQFHPPVQRFSPADRRVYPLWEVAEELRLPVMVTTGFTLLGAGEPGGGGIELGYADPMHIDRVAADFPRLPIILANPFWPWRDAAIAVARHKGNVYLELSGWSPADFPPILLDAIQGPLAERTLFGSDFPFFDFARWLEAWDALGLPAEVSRRVLVDNAAELLRIDVS